LAEEGANMIKIIVDKQAKLYELTYLLPVDFTDSKRVATSESILKLITKYKGKVSQTQDWGKKDLAYKIKHQGKFCTEAVYTHQVVKFSPDKVQAFERELLLEETILRHLLVTSDTQGGKEIVTKEGASAIESKVVAKKKAATKTGVQAKKKAPAKTEV